MLAATLATVIVFAIVTYLALAAYVWSKYNTPLTVPYALTMVTVAGWTTAYGLALFSDSLPEKVFFRQFAYVFFPFAAVFWYLCVRRYTTPDAHPPVSLSWWVYVVPAVTAMLALTNPFHEWLEHHYRLVPWGALHGLSFERGPMQTVQALHSLVMMMAVAVLLLRFSWAESSPYFRRRTQLLMILSVAPVPAIFAFQMALTPIPGFSVAPLLLAPICVGHWYVLFRYHVFELLPVARQSIFSSLADGVLVFDQTCRLVDFNSAAASMLDLAMPRSMGAGCETLFANSKIAGWLHTGADTPRIFPGEGPATGRSWEMSIHKVYGDDGRQCGGFVVIRDVTERLRAELELRDSEVRYRQLIEQSPVPTLLTDPEDDRIVLVNRATIEWAGLRPDDIVGVPASSFYVDAESRRRIIDDLIRTGQVTDVEVDLRRGTRGKALVWLSARLIQWQGRTCALSTFVDITERRAVEAALKAGEIKVRELAVVEDEKQRIGRDLHDSLGQRLTGVAMLCRAVEDRLAADVRPEHNDLRTIRKHLNDAVDEARLLAHGLNPGDLSGTGLWTALDEQVRHVRRISQVECTLVPSQPLVIADVNAAIHLLRITQESINNALLHASPRAIRVTVTVDAGVGGTLEVTDDGAGFDVAAVPQSRGRGLEIMKVRSQLINGTLKVTSRRGHGTTVTCHFPVIAAPSVGAG